MELRDRIDRVRGKIKKVCELNDRRPQDVTLLLATKTVSPERINEALELGQRVIGENKVQEFLKKYPHIDKEKTSFHFIGHLQSNKVKDLLYKIHLLHSLDRLSLLKELDKRLAQDGRTLDVLIQVNTSHEESKFGLPEAEVVPFLKTILETKTLRPKGFMTLAALTKDRETARGAFRRLRLIRDEAEQKFSLALPDSRWGCPTTSTSPSKKAPRSFESAPTSSESVNTPIPITGQKNSLSAKSSAQIVSNGRDRIP